MHVLFVDKDGVVRVVHGTSDTPASRPAGDVYCRVGRDVFQAATRSEYSFDVLAEDLAMLLGSLAMGDLIELSVDTILWGVLDAVLPADHQLWRLMPKPGGWASDADMRNCAAELAADGYGDYRDIVIELVEPGEYYVGRDVTDDPYEAWTFDEAIKIAKEILDGTRA
jgi:hypothetical protein